MTFTLFTKLSVDFWWVCLFVSSFNFVGIFVCVCYWVWFFCLFVCLIFGGDVVSGGLFCLLRLTCDLYCVLKINRVFMTKCQIDATAVIFLSTKGCKGC